jgi:hypothetical protein
MIKALLVGCGNIGAGYDLNDSNKVWTHAKAYYLNENITLSVFDEDEAKAKEIARKYNAIVFSDLQNISFNQFDIVSITTPTTVHFSYLNRALNDGVPVVICEKPVVSSIVQVQSLEELYPKASTKVLVNYIRRFQPGYSKAKEKLLLLHKEQTLRNIVIKYKRGFLNNASHAIDLLEFIFESPFSFTDFYATHILFDAFDYDPTLVGNCTYMGCPVSFIGVPNTIYAIFEIELFFENAKVVVCHSGNEIRYYYADSGNLQENYEERQTNLLDNYMVYVLEEAIQFLYNRDRKDNFMSSLRINKKVLQIIEPLKNNFNARISY